MSGVDSCDQMVSYYSSPRKTCKWYKKVILHSLDLAVWNTYYIYKKKFNDENKENKNFKDFRDMIIKDLISLPPNITSYEISTANKNKKRKKKTYKRC